MHVLTKILAVLSALLCVLLAALTMAFSVNASRITAAFNNERALAQRAVASEQAALSQAQAEQARLQGLNASFEAELNNLKQQNSQLRSENSSLRADKQQAEASRDAIQQQIAQHGETARMQAALIEAYGSEATGLRDQLLRAQRESIALNDRINDLESQNEILTQNNRAFQEQIAELQLAMASLQSNPEGAVTGASFEISGPPVEGRVTEVQRDQDTGHTFARIDVGANDRIQNNAKLSVVRPGAGYVGNLIVVTTDLQWAIARFDSLGQNTAVQVGDTVLSSLSR